MTWVNENKTTNVTRVLKTPSAELSQNVFGERTRKKYFVVISVLQSPECSMNKFRARSDLVCEKYIYIYIHIYIYIYIYIY